MNLVLTRLKDNGVSTIGRLEVDSLRLYTIEDTYRTEKIWGQTRIPAGIYEIELRVEGLKHKKYSKKYSFHEGMLWLRNVPGYEYVLMHIGNSVKDTNGCILVGSKILNDDYITGSATAYINLYTTIIKAFNRGEQIFIKITDNEENT